jgi:hypothetical protein
VAFVTYEHKDPLKNLSSRRSRTRHLDAQFLVNDFNAVSLHVITSLIRG